MKKELTGKNEFSGMNKKIVIIFIMLLSLIITWRLFSFSLIIGDGGGFLPIGISFYYDWIASSYIAIAIFCMIVYLGFEMLLIEEPKKRLKLAIICLITSLLGTPVFYILSSDFRFYELPTTVQYESFNGEVNIDKYLEYMKKYCKDNDGWEFQNRDRSVYCGIKGKYRTKYNTVEEYAKIFDYARENNLKELYYRTFIGAKKFGYDKLIKGYKDKTFQVYAVKEATHYNILDILEKEITDIDVLNLFEFYISKINENKIIMEKLDSEDWRNYWEEVYKEVDKKIQQIEGINHKIF